VAQCFFFNSPPCGEEVRAGERGPTVRHVPVASLAGVAVRFAIVYLYFTSSPPDAPTARAALRHSNAPDFRRVFFMGEEPT
jgi:hypothetical protein